MGFSRRPSLAERTMSSPQALRINTLSNTAGHNWLFAYKSSTMTPPASPAQSIYSRSSMDLPISPEDTRNGMLQVRKTQDSQSVAPRDSDGNIVCPFTVDVLVDGQGRKQVFGHGAWSTVYKATCRGSLTTSSGLMTPPQSPSNRSPPIMVAVKKPARKDATPILRSEAAILTHLMQQPHSDHYVVPFYGIITLDSSLVLEAIPLSLEDYVKNCAAAQHPSGSSVTATQPVIGAERVWLSLAYSLISALSWLHTEAGVVHGDIKPGNILLSSDSDYTEFVSPAFPYRPVFSDFSSSQLHCRSVPTLNTLSAVTREYTAPELLSSKVLMDPLSTATTASDVFSLAVTLIAAATGDTMVYSGSRLQRQAMATQGWNVVNNVRNSSESGLRLPRHGMVENVVERAVLKKDMGRIKAEAWKELVEDMMMA